MADIKYSKEHEWILVESNTGTVGISDFAQEQLGDVVFVELPDVGKAMKKGDEGAVVESVKTASEVYAPATGEIIAVNDALNDDPDLVNTDPMGNGWFFKISISDAADLDDLMDEATYKAFAEG
ncbi:MAG: glycine cleavage system protein GcvH [Rhodospirillales bacterium]|jgi:glycine cleavage system H protein